MRVLSINGCPQASHRNRSAVYHSDMARYKVRRAPSRKVGLVKAFFGAGHSPLPGLLISACDLFLLSVYSSTLRTHGPGPDLKQSNGPTVSLPRGTGHFFTDAWNSGSKDEIFPQSFFGKLCHRWCGRIVEFLGLAVFLLRLFVSEVFGMISKEFVFCVVGINLVFAKRPSLNFHVVIDS